MLLSPNSRENSIIKLCSENNLYTITPSIVAMDNTYKTIKENISSGSIILINNNKQNLSSLNTIIDYIEGKGLKIEGLSKLITEQINWHLKILSPFLTINKIVDTINMYSLIIN